MYAYLPYQFDPSKTLANIKRDDPSEIAKFTINRTYSRAKTNAVGEMIGKESIEDINVRVVSGTISILADRLRELSILHENSHKLEDYAERLFVGMTKRRITPAGRGLWAMGTKIVNKDKLGIPLVNCTFITSSNIALVREQFFHYIMDTLMLGVGVGFDTEGAGKITINLPSPANFVSHEGYHRYINQLNEFKDEKFINDKGNSYIKYEINYTLNILLMHRHRVVVHVIEDSREGWCNALCALLRSYFEKDQYIVIFDYSAVRPAGADLKGFGGKASGPKPLAELLASTRYILHENYIGKPIDEIFIIDIANLIARTVVAGNVRRSSEICISKNARIVDCKLIHREEYKYRANWAWNSNNSYCVDELLSRSEIAEILNNVRVNGEPGIFFRYNSQKYGRIQDGINMKDKAIRGVNPCGEIGLEGTSEIASPTPYSAGGETCNLVETFPSNYNFQFKEWDLDWDLLYKALSGQSEGNLDIRQLNAERAKLNSYLKDYLEDLFIANLYCKIVTLVPVHWKSTEVIQGRNRRIGISMSGIAVLLAQMGLLEDDKAGILYSEEESITFKRFAVFLDTCYKHVQSTDCEISELLDIPKSIKLTTVKPSGTVSICNDVPSGMHFPYSNYYIRRIRVSANETELIATMRNAGYKIGYPAKEPNTVIIEFPVKISHETYPRDAVGIDLQFKIYLYLQRYWADNSVSCTFTFKEHEFERICDLVYEHQEHMKGLSCLPYFDDGSLAYEFMPNERITREQYDEIAKQVRKVNHSNSTPTVEIEYDTYCDGDKCYRVEKV